MKKWWQKKAPDILKLPMADLPLLDQKGDEIGRIIINPDGVFVGEIESGVFRRKLAAAITHGFVGSFSLLVHMPEPKSHPHHQGEGK